MTDATRPPVSNVPEFSVSEISGALKRTVEENFSLVRVRGEISGFKRHSSGHLYFALKDADAVMDAVCWRGQAQKLGMGPEDGMEIIATGRLTTYPGRSKYQMVVERMELAGQGALLKLLEDRRRKLAAEGLFDTSRKRPLPFLPRTIGVVTSPTGAVIRDILHRLADRFPSHVLLWPVAVQGDGAAAQVAAAIDGFNRIEASGPVPRPDLLIVARGGGSVEDLWAFNEEIVVRAAAASDIPLISAVGHETDTTLIDFASDRRAPTPTAAAEMAVPVRADLIYQVNDCRARLTTALTRGLDERRLRLEAIARALPHPRRIIEDCWLKLDDRAERLKLALPNLLHRHGAELDKVAARLTHALDKARSAELARQERDRLRLSHASTRLPDALTRAIDTQARRLDTLAKLLESYSYRKVLERGYAVVRDGDGHVVCAPEASPGTAWTVEFKDGSADVVVGPQAGSSPAPKPRWPRGGKDGRQGSLL